MTDRQKPAGESRAADVLHRMRLDIINCELKPGEKPEAIFMTNAEAKDVTAREYCNLHGLWKG